MTAILQFVSLRSIYLISLRQYYHETSSLSIKKKTIAALLTMNEREKTMKKNTWT